VGAPPPSPPFSLRNLVLLARLLDSGEVDLCVFLSRYFSFLNSPDLPRLTRSRSNMLEAVRVFFFFGNTPSLSVLPEELLFPTCSSGRSERKLVRPLSPCVLRAGARLPPYFVVPENSCTQTSGSPAESSKEDVQGLRGLFKCGNFE